MHITWGLIDPGLRFVQGMADVETRPTWHLDALRNETIVAQALLACDEPSMATLGNQLTFAWTAKLPRLRIEAQWQKQAQRGTDPSISLHWVGFVPDDSGNQVADPLLPQEGLSLTASQAQPVWVNIRVPEHTEPGNYELVLTVYGHREWDAEEKLATCTLSVTVHSATLPHPRDFAFHLDLWQHPTRLAQFHNVPRWSERHWNIIEAYAKELATCGQKVITVIASDAPWGGQGCWDVRVDPFAFYEFNMVEVAREPDGSLRCDFGVLARYIETFQRHGIDAEIEVYGLLGAWHDVFGTPLTDYPDPIRVRCYDVAAGRYDYLRTRAELGEYVGHFVQYLRSRGWFEATRIASDEPKNLERFESCLAFLRSIDPDMRFKIACNHAPFMDQFKDEVLDWVPYIDVLARDEDLSKRLADDIRARGGRMSWYLCCYPSYPNQFMHSLLVETRLVGWLTDWFRLDGFLRWAVAAWPNDPWNRPQWKSIKFPAGDMFLVYPGLDGKPVPSLRWEMLRQGIQEFELLRLARQEIDHVIEQDPEAGAAYQSRLDAALGQVVRAESMGKFQVEKRPADQLYALDYADYDTARAQVIALISEAASPR